MQFTHSGFRFSAPTYDKIGTLEPKVN